MGFDPELLISRHLYICTYISPSIIVVYTYLHSNFMVHVSSYMYVRTFVVRKFRVTPVYWFVL